MKEKECFYTRNTHYKPVLPEQQVKNVGETSKKGNIVSLMCAMTFPFVCSSTNAYVSLSAGLQGVHLSISVQHKYLSRNVTHIFTERVELFFFSLTSTPHNLRHDFTDTLYILQYKNLTDIITRTG